MYINYLAFMMESFSATTSMNDTDTVVNTKASSSLVKCHFVEYNSNFIFESFWKFP